MTNILVFASFILGHNQVLDVDDWILVISFYVGNLTAKGGKVTRIHLTPKQKAVFVGQPLDFKSNSFLF